MFGSPPRPANEILPGTIIDPVTVPPHPLDVDADVTWPDGTATTVTGRALSWNPVAVHVQWYQGWRGHTAWLPVSAVRRRRD